MSINELDAACYDERLGPISKRAWTMQEQLLSNCYARFYNTHYDVDMPGGHKKLWQLLIFSA
jgi:hypothetical protein